MGCSSSRGTREELITLPGGLPKNRHNGTDILDDETAKKQKLILERGQRSMEGRQRQTLVQNLVHDEFRRQITEVYDLEGGKLLGKGGFGTVQAVIHKQSGKKYALKAVELSRVKDEKSLDFFYREVEVMRSLDHPNICRLHAVYPTVDYLFMIMDLCEGGDLLTTYHFKSEREAADIVLKVTSAVRYMHDRKIAHRDLKLDNILTDFTKDGADVKLVDFGLSAHFEDFKLEHDIVGTWVYMAPEVISGSHFPRTCDMWSIGVITYLLLCGYPPFGGSSTAELKEQIQHGTYQFHHDAWSGISAKAKNFIKRLLVRNPQERMSATEAQHHPWLNPDTPGSKGVNICKEAVRSLSRFRAHNYLKKLALEMVARSLDTEQIRFLEQCFNSMDKDGSGTISFEEFESVLATQDNLSKGDIREMFESADVDNGKELHFNEFLAATMGRRDLDERRLRLAFDRLDFDHSGTIDAEDLKIIVGSALGEEDVESLLSEFDINKDGKIDFDEFTITMRRVDGPGSELPVLPLATARAQSLPDLKVEYHLKHLEKTIERNSMHLGDKTQDVTPPPSIGSVHECHDRHSAVARANLVRCASRLVENQYNRRTTVAISNPASKQAIARLALRAIGAERSARWIGSAPPAAATGSRLEEKLEGESVVSGLEATLSHHEVEEPMPYGQLHVPAVSVERNGDQQHEQHDKQFPLQ